MTDQPDRALALAGARLDALILEFVREVHGSTAIERPARYLGDRTPVPTPTPLAGISATKQLAGRLHREIVFHARRAREAGHAWDEIGEALGLKSTNARTRAEAAFESMAWRTDGNSTDSLGWRCGGCDHSIVDRGPYSSPPEDSEIGHGADCPRLDADVERRRPSRDCQHEEGAPPHHPPRPNGGIRREPPDYDL